MDIHEVKPVHGWREFFGEVGIIVIGVLIALIAEGVVERLHWREQIAAGREALKGDAESYLHTASEREAVSACLAHRFGKIAAIIDAASTSGQLPPVGAIGNPPAREWRLPSWDSLVASQVTTHMTHADLDAFNSIIEGAAYSDQINREEFNDWSTLFTIVGPGRRFNPGEEAPLRQALSHAVYEAKLLRIIAFQTSETIKQSGLLSPAEIRQALSETPDEAHGAPLCAPIGPAPAHYGEGPFKYDLAAPASQG